MFAFIVVWFGQMVSMLGTGMTRFALGIWAWDATAQAQPFAWIALASFGPGVILSPLAGALVDRWNRKLVMILSDLAAGLSTIALFILFFTGQLEIWHIIVAGAFASAFESFQFPAYSASVTLMLKNKDHYARASGLMSLAEAASGIVSPILAGVLLGLLAIQRGTNTIMMIDIVTFLFAIGAVLFVHIPQPVKTEEEREKKGNLIEEIGYGFEYILKRPSLIGLQMVFFFINLTATFGFVVLAPMILARTDSSAPALAAVQTAFGVGGLVGGLLLGIWGGTKRKVHGVLLGMAFSAASTILLGVGQSLPFWIVGAFLTMFFLPFINGSNQAIWQSKIPPDVQGRVFSVRRWIAQITAPVAMFAAGPIADKWLGPAMQPGGSLANTFGGLVGTGPGAGMALMFVFSGLLGIVVGLGGYLFPAIRNAETILPDAVIEEEQSEEEAAAPLVGEAAAGAASAAS
jgi:predicted MFS family arabinose efflux permease